MPELKLRNLTKMPDYGLYKITFYEGTNNEYYTFTTRECAQTGIDNYLLYRQRLGEKISFNENLNSWQPDDVPLIRLQFDMNDIIQVRNPQPMKLQGLRWALHTHLIRSGLRQLEHPISIEDSKRQSVRVRKDVALSKGFRKYCISAFIKAGLNHEIRELLVDHATGLDASYFRPSEQQVLQEYLKAEPLLTVDPSARLAYENQTLKVELSQFDTVLDELKTIKQTLGLQ